MDMKTILTKEIRNIIDRNGPNRLYMVSDFAHLNNDGLVTRALSRLEKEGGALGGSRISEQITPPFLV